MRQPDSRWEALRAAIGRHEPIVLLAMAPFFLFPSPRRAAAALAIPALAWMAQRDGRPWFPPTPVNGALLVLAALIVCSLAVTPDPAYSLPKVMGAIYGIACFAAVVRWMNRNGAHDARARAGFVGLAAAFAAFALVTTNWIPKFPVLSDITRRLPRLLPQLEGAEGGLHPNAIAGLLVLFIPAQVALVLGDGTSVPRTGRWMQIGALALTASTIVLTQSRGAWAGLAVGLIGFGLMYGRTVRRAIAAAAIVAVLAVLAAGPGRVMTVVAAHAGPGFEANVIGRGALWGRALAAVSDFPFTGVGLNMFRRVVPVLYPTTLAGGDVRQDIVHAHNQFLQVAVDLGLPGLLAYVALWIGVGRVLFVTYGLARTPSDRRIVVGLTMGLVAHLVFGIADAIALGAKLGLVFWLMLAFVVGTCLRMQTASRREAVPLREAALTE